MGVAEAFGVSKLARRCVGVTVVLCIAWLFAFPGAGDAEARVRCSPVGYVYPAGQLFYSIAGMRCDRRVFKIAVSGYVVGDNRPPFYELRKSCRNTRVCLDVSPNFRNPPGRQRWRVVFAAGFKEHWYSIPTYRGFSRYFYF